MGWEGKWSFKMCKDSVKVSVWVRGDLCKACYIFVKSTRGWWGVVNFSHHLEVAHFIQEIKSESYLECGGIK